MRQNNITFFPKFLILNFFQGFRPRVITDETHLIEKSFKLDKIWTFLTFRIVIKINKEYFNRQ